MTKPLSENTPVVVRMAVLWALVGASAVAGGAFAVAQYQITQLRDQVNENQRTQDEDHELLVRIDERAEQIHRDQQKILNWMYQTQTPGRTK
jgi:hypothetical protein